jgi:hypothetical protein
MLVATICSDEKGSQMQGTTTTLPEKIDWGQLEFRFRSPDRLSAWWDGTCLASVTANRPQDLVALLRKQVDDQHWRDMLRPKGAQASRTVDDMFAEVVTAWPELRPSA